MMSLLLAFLVLAVVPRTALAGEGDTPPVVGITTVTPHSIVIVAGDEGTIDLSAYIIHDPVSRQECTLTGPDWSWSASANASIESSDEAASLSFTFPTAGIYSISASATAKYSSSCDTDGVSGTGNIDFSVKVVAKTWEVSTPVGQDVDGEGHTVNNGRMTAPVDTTDTAHTPATVFYVLKGENVPCEVEEATDIDKWTLDLNGDDQIDPNPDHGEFGFENDEIRYKWTSDNGGTFTSANSASTGWSSDTTGTYTLTCTIDDKWDGTETGVTAPEVGNRNDSPITRSIQVVVYTVSMKITRQNSGHDEDTAIVAAGALPGYIHIANVKLQADPAIAGIPINAPVIREGNGLGVLIPADLTVTNDKTNGDGQIIGTYVSSDQIESVPIDLYLKHQTENEAEGDNPDAPAASPDATVTADQHWNDDFVPWNYPLFFNYNQGTPVAYEPRFRDNNPAQTLVPITGHQLSFSVVGAWVYQWNEEEGRYDPVEYENEPHSRALPAALSATTLAEFDTPQPKGDGGNGSYSSNLTVTLNYDEIVAYVSFRTDDEGTYEPDAALEQP